MADIPSTITKTLVTNASAVSAAASGSAASSAPSGGASGDLVGNYPAPLLAAAIATVTNLSAATLSGQSKYQGQAIADAYISSASTWNTAASQAAAAFGWGNHASVGYLTAEADTLATVTARGASTTAGITVNGDITMVGNVIASGDSDTYLDFYAANSFEVVVGGSAELQVSNIGVVATGDFSAYGFSIFSVGVQVFGALSCLSKISGTRFQTSPISTTTRDALIDVSNGMLVYNSTTDKFQGYAGGAWVDLH